MPPRRKKNKKNVISAEEVIKQNQALAEERKQKAEEDMAAFDYDDERFKAAGEDEKVEKMQQYMLLSAGEHITTGKEESFKNAVNTEESRQMLIRIGTIFPWTKAIAILINPLFMSYIFGDLVPGKLSKAAAREAFLTEVLEPLEKENKPEVVNEEPKAEEPNVDFPVEEGRYLTQEEKKQLADYKELFADEKKYSALSAEEKKELCNKYLVLNAKNDCQYKPDMEQQMMNELAEYQPMVDQAIEAMIKGQNKAANVEHEMRQVYMQGLAFGKTLYGHTDEQKLEEFQAFMDYNVPEYMTNAEYKKQYIKEREEQKNKVQEVNAAAKQNNEPENKPGNKQEEKKEEKKEENRNIKKEEKKPEKVKPWEELSDEKKSPVKAGVNFSFEGARKETKELVRLINEVDFMMLGKGSKEFREMKDKVKLLATMAEAGAKNKEINPYYYCAVQEMTINAMEAYLERKEGQFGLDPSRKNDPKRQKREQPRIRNTIKALGILRNSFERNKGIYVDEIRDQYRKNINYQINNTMKEITKDKERSSYISNVLTAVDQLYKLDKSNLEMRSGESPAEYKSRLESSYTDQNKVLDDYLKDPKKHPHANIIEEAARRFTGGVFNGKEYPGNEKINAKRLVKMVMADDKFFNAEPEPYYNQQLVNSIDGDIKRRTESLVSKEAVKNTAKNATTKSNVKKNDKNLKTNTAMKK